MLNAYQAMPTGGQLHIASRADGDEVRAVFADTGAGISPENLKRVFDPFFTTKEVGEGTGLGLSISYGIIEQHGGTIEVSSRLGEGSSFTFSLMDPEGDD